MEAFRGDNSIKFNFAEIFVRFGEFWDLTQKQRKRNIEARSENGEKKNSM